MAAVRAAQHDAGAEHLVPLAEHSGADVEGFPADGPGRAQPAVHGRLHVEDRNAAYHPATLPIAEWVHVSRLPLIAGRVHVSRLPLIAGRVHVSRLPLIAGRVHASRLPLIAGRVHASRLPLITGRVHASRLPLITGRVHASRLPPITGPVQASRYGPSPGPRLGPGYGHPPARNKVALRESDPAVHHPSGPARGTRAVARADAESALVVAFRHAWAFCRD